MIVFNRLGSLGQLGNQMFQVAVTVSHAKKMGTKAQFSPWEYKKYFLNPIDDQLDMTFDEKFNGVDHETHFVGDFHYVPLPAKKNLVLYGFFQSEKYFDIEQIKFHFKPKNEFLQVVRKAGSDFLHLQNLVAIHVRRGDYLEKPEFHPILPYSYYQEGLQLLREKYGKLNVVIFSDDMDWCKKHLWDENVHFAEGNSNMVDLYLMAHCRHSIIANSSFSWWGAWLKRLFQDEGSTQGTVIAPSPWFGPACNYDTKDLYCDGWKLLECK